MIPVVPRSSHSLREESLRWIEEVEALDEGLQRMVNTEELKDYLGIYGESEFTLSQGQLIYRDTDLEEEWSLQPLQKDHFQLEGDNTRRIQFLQSQADSMPEALLLTRQASTRHIRQEIIFMTTEAQRHGDAFDSNKNS